MIEISEVITAIASMIGALAAVGTLIFSIWNTKQIEVIHKQTNSMKDELVAEVRKNAWANGHNQGEQEKR